MGTKIQSNRFLSGYYSIWGLNESVNNDILPIYNDGKALKNGQHYDPVLPQKLMMVGHLGYEKEKLRQMILEHELTFRHQLQELHRLYGRQREIMNELKRREIKNNQMEPQTSHPSSFPLHIFSDDAKPTWHGSHTSLLHSLLDQASALQKSSLPSFRKGKTVLGPFSRDEGNSEKCEPPAPNSNRKVLRSRMFDLEMPGDVYMNNDCKKLGNNFCELPGIGSVSKTSIDEILHNKDVNHHQNGDTLRSNLRPKRSNHLADLNEPILLEENSVSVVGNSGSVASTLTDIGREQLRIDFRATIMSDDSHPSTRDACSKASQADLRRDFPTSDWGITKSQMKRKLFGVDIFEVDDKLLHTDPSMANGNLITNKRANDFLPEHTGQEALPKSFEGSTCLNWKSAKGLETAKQLTNVIQNDVIPGHNIVNADYQSEQNDSSRSLCCCSRTKYCGQQARTNKNSYHLNLDSLQHNCQQFFQKSRTTSLSSQVLVQKQEIASLHLVQGTAQKNIAVDGYSNARKINNFSVSNSKELSCAGILCKEIHFGADGNNSGHVLVEKAISKDEPKTGDVVLDERIKNCLSGLQQHIDLNLSLTEDEASSSPSLPSTTVKIVRTEINLEAPMIVKSEADIETNLSTDELKEPYEELLKGAAEAIVAISLSDARGTLKVAIAESLEASARSHLSWFSELVCSYKCHDLSSTAELNVDDVVTEEMIPDGMDYFEFMTLRLQDTKEDNYQCRPLITENVKEGNEETKVPTRSRRLRRGQARKGRQRKDFQRDILPGLVTLSKHEVVEDFQTLEELFKSCGCEWQSNLLSKAAVKSSRRRRSSNPGVSTPPQESDAIFHSLDQQPLYTDVQLEEKHLSGWGKRTRRLPRQRYMNGNHAFQLKP